MDPVANREKGKERETEPVSDDSQAQSSSSPHTQTNPISRPATPELFSESLSESRAIGDEGRPASVLDNVELPPALNPSDLDPVPPLQRSEDIAIEEPPTPPPIQSPSPDPLLAASPPRHFPPPGTLVVVQGVVNTTDTGSNSLSNNSNTSNTSSTSPVTQTPSSRPNSSLFPAASRTSRSSTPTGDRIANRNSHRLSSIMRRPTSIFNDNRRSSAMLDNDPVTDTSSSVADPSTESSTSNDSSSPNDSGSATTVESDNDIQSQLQRPLSPGSIDVLGTLLSVAAAATAASLFSPNSFSARNSDSSPESDGNRPTSPTPTAGLGVNGFGPLDTLAGLGFPMERESQPQPTNFGVGSGTGGHNVNRDRLRGAWDTLRDRLGLHNARANGTDDELQPANETNEDGVRGGSTGAGDTMISEMARALGTGLGLQEDGGPRRPASEHRAPSTTGGVADPPAVSASAPSNSPLPVEGSFERFLFNLQADLRAVLSDDSPTEPTTATTEAAVPPAADAEVAESPSTPQNQREGQESPAFRDEVNGNEEVVTVEEAGQRTGVDVPSAEPSNDPHIPPLNHDRRTGGGINLWRSYRFPPIVAPSRPSPLYQPGNSIPGSSALPAGVVSDSAPTYSLPYPRPENESVSAAIPQGPEPLPSSTTSTIPPLPEIPALDIVVPVIIVGLQSVNVDNRGDQQHDEHESIFTRPDPMSEAAEREATTSVGGIPNEERPTTPRGRPWHSRAANALRNLRPGRRPGTATAGANDRNASRTFLIYVIGGYYPPNHHIVTGTDGMDSYEALWELAALLGQVKPPVATPEDIENSGLQIIKPSEIEQYAGDGQVASNCIDRCLICLDDYEPEDDLRVMSCKHFFHKTCVDKWLQIGRNNCPACRTKGVSTNSDPEPIPPSQQTSTTTPVA